MTSDTNSNIPQKFTSSSIQAMTANRSSVVMNMAPQGLTSESTQAAVKSEDSAELRAPADYMFARSDFSKEKEKLDEVLNSGVLFRYHAPEAKNIPVAQLEEKYCELFGYKYALAVNSASSGLLLSLLAAGVKEGDSVLMPAFTFVAVPSSIVLSGATPVLVEIDESYSMDPEHLEEQIAKYKPKYMMLSYMRGAIPDMDKILAIVKKHDITLIEDIAHAMGVKWKGTQVGTFGQSSVTSFQSHKICDAGEGGMLGTDDIDVFLRAAFLSGCYEANIKKHLIDHPEKEEKIKQYLNKIPPYNLRMNNMTAALLFNQFDILEDKADHHREMYKAVFDNLDKTHLTFPPVHPNTTAVLDSIQFSLSTFSVEQRKEIQAKLNGQGIPLQVIGLAKDNARVFYNWKFIDEARIQADDFPRTKEFIESMCDLRLP